MCSAVYGTTHYEEPLKTFDKSIGNIPDCRDIYTIFNKNTPHRYQRLNYLAEIRLKTVSNISMASFDHGHSGVYFCPNI